MEHKTFNFTKGKNEKYSSLDGGYIFIDDVFSFSPYNGETLEDILDRLDFRKADLKSIPKDKLDEICSDFGDNDFKTEYKMEAGMSSVPIAVEVANCWWDKYETYEDGVIVSEDFTFYDYITIDPEFASEYPKEFVLEKKYLKSVLKENPKFSEHLTPIIKEMNDPRELVVYVIKYGFQYAD